VGIVVLHGYTANFKDKDMYFDHDDVNRMISDLQYTRIMKPSGAKQHIHDLVSNAVGLQNILAQYPKVRYEPLDYHYVLLKYMAAFNVNVLADLCSGQYSWRGIVIAGWLASLKPNTEYIDHLLSVSVTQYPDNYWLIHLALAEANQKCWAENTELQSLVTQLRGCLAPISLPNFGLRYASSAASVDRMSRDKEAIKVAYRSGGLSAGLSVLEKNRLEAES
jgi:hypothetical protein